MNRQRSVLVLIIFPAVVALLVTLLVLYIWDSRQPKQQVVVLPTHSATSLIAPRETSPSSEQPGGAETSEAAGGSSSPGDVEAVDTVDPGCENPVHAVAGGEVLGSIAESYGVSVDDLVTLNEMLDPAFDPDFLSIGQELVIPVCGVPTPTPTFTPTATLVPTRVVPTPISTATELPPGTVQVAITGVFNPGDITTEVVEIVNEGSPVNMEDWVLSNGRGQEFVFPSFRLFSGGRVAIHTGVGEDTPIDLFWGLNQPVWQIDDVVSLFDADGELHDEFVIE